ncbi:MAG TPA: adenosylcobinamide-GDP ribazoletransferase [Puia sp.]|jgi:adenosylcobinamide-GDP ribazoletransferase
MKKEWRVFLTAIMFLTRIRVPASMSVDHSPEYLQQAPRYFPVVGWIVGGISSLAFLVASRYISTDIGILAAMITGILVTGAFHEDGFADVCDGFGGGWTREKILVIMKDSRIGAYGAIGLIALLASRFLMLKELPSFTPTLNHPGSSVFYNYRYFILALIAAHSLSRLMPMLMIQGSVYAADPDQSKAKPMVNNRLSVPAFLLAVVLALLPFIFLPRIFLLVILPALYTTWEMARYFIKWIGGYTGDCLGAIQQVTEIVIYLGFVIVWRYL